MNLERLSISLAALVWGVSAATIVVLVAHILSGFPATIPLVGDLLGRQNVAERLAPFAILIISAWILVEISVHEWQVIRERRAAHSLADQLERVAAGSEAAGLDIGSISEHTRAARRGRLILNHIDDAGTLHDVIPGAAALDAASLVQSYSTLRIYTWTLPVVGFIGTALGMSNAIGGFSAALGAKTSIVELTAQLGHDVIPGLATAFAVTIAALLAAVIGHFCTSVVQGQEERTLVFLDQTCLRFLARHPKEIGVPTVSPALNEAARELKAAAQEIRNAVDQLHATTAEFRATIDQPYVVTISRGEQQ